MFFHGFFSMISSNLSKLWKSKVCSKLSFSKSLFPLAFASFVKLCQFGFIATFDVNTKASYNFLICFHDYVKLNITKHIYRFEL
jgi:hypothetical protein